MSVTPQITAYLYVILSVNITCGSPEMQTVNVIPFFILSQRALHIVLYQNVNYQMASLLAKESSLSIGGGASGSVVVFPCVR
jgi:hypothetical protein